MRDRNDSIVDAVMRKEKCFGKTSAAVIFYIAAAVFLGFSSVGVFGYTIYQYNEYLSLEDQYSRNIFAQNITNSLTNKNVSLANAYTCVSINNTNHLTLKSTVKDKIQGLVHFEKNGINLNNVVLSPNEEQSDGSKKNKIYFKNQLVFDESASGQSFLFNDASTATKLPINVYDNSITHVPSRCVESRKDNFLNPYLVYDSTFSTCIGDNLLGTCTEIIDAYKNGQQTQIPMKKAIIQCGWRLAICFKDDQTGEVLEYSASLI